MFAPMLLFFFWTKVPQVNFLLLLTLSSEIALTKKELMSANKSGFPLTLSLTTNYVKTTKCAFQDI